MLFEQTYSSEGVPVPSFSSTQKLLLSLTFVTTFIRTFNVRTMSVLVFRTSSPSLAPPGMFGVSGDRHGEWWYRVAVCRSVLPPSFAMVDAIVYPNQYWGSLIRPKNQTKTESFVPPCHAPWLVLSPFSVNMAVCIVSSTSQIRTVNWGLPSLSSLWESKPDDLRSVKWRT